MEIIKFSICPGTRKNQKVLVHRIFCPKEQISLYLTVLQLFFQKQYETRSTLVNSMDPDQLASLENSVDPDQLASEKAS